MRVLVVAQYFPPRRSTFSSRWAWLTVHLAERNHTVDVLAFLSANRQLGNLRHAFAADPPPAGVRFHPVRPAFQGNSLIMRGLADALTAIRAAWRSRAIDEVDVVVASAPSLMTIPVGRLLASRRKVPFVLDLRDAWPELMADWREWDDDGTGPTSTHPVKRFVLGAGVALLSRLIDRARMEADAVIVTSERLAAKLRDQGASRVALVRNTSAKPWPYGLPRVPSTSDELRVLYMGNVGRAQRLTTAVRAAARARDAGTRLTLRIVGSGPHWAATKRLAEELDAPVEFVERVPTYQVLDHYRWADSVLVMLREWACMRDTVPSKLYEALLTCRHITASTDGESADLVRRHGSGDVVPPGDVDALATLWTELAHDRQRLHISLSGRHWVRKVLTPESLSHSFEDVLSAVVAERRSEQGQFRH